DLLVGGAAQPGVAFELIVQLAGTPASIAQRDQMMPGAAMFGNCKQDVTRGSQFERAHLGAVLIAVLATVQYEAVFHLYWAAQKHRNIVAMYGEQFFRL